MSSDDQDTLSIPFEVKKKVAAFDMYLMSYPAEEIAQKCELPLTLIRHWIGEEAWEDTRRAAVRDFKRLAVDKFTTFSLQERLDVAQEQLKSSKQLLAVIADKYEVQPNGRLPYLTPQELQKVAQAFKSVSDIQARAVGLTDKPFSDEHGRSNAPTVIVNVSPQEVADPVATAKPVVPRTIEDPF